MYNPGGNRDDKSINSVFNKNKMSTKYPPPSNEYKQPNIRFESPSSSQQRQPGLSVIQVTPKNIPYEPPVKTTIAPPPTYPGPTTDPRSGRDVPVSSLDSRAPVIYTPSNSLEDPSGDSSPHVKQLPVHRVHYPHYLPKKPLPKEVSLLGPNPNLYASPPKVKSPPPSKHVSSLTTARPNYLNKHGLAYGTPPPRQSDHHVSSLGDRRHVTPPPTSYVHVWSLPHFFLSTFLMVKKWFV